MSVLVLLYTRICNYISSYDDRTLVAKPPTTKTILEFPRSHGDAPEHSIH